MRLDATLLAGYSEENLRDAVTDVVADDVFDEKHRQPNAHDGIDEVEPVGTRLDELTCEQFFNLPDEPLQQKSCASREDADEETDEQHEVLVGQVPAPPTKQVGYEVTYIYHLIIYHLLPSPRRGVRGER